MKRLTYFFLFIIFLLSIITFVCCNKDEEKDNQINPGDNCETVINAQGPGYLKVINTLNKKVRVYLPDYAFGARLNANKCEIYGMATGTGKAEISICVDDDCNTISNTKEITFVLETGGTYTVTIDDNFFSIFSFN